MATAAPGLRLYRSRRPERAVLYRALADQFEHFLGVYEERFEPARGNLRRSLARAVYRYLGCLIFTHGAARSHCAECGHDVLIAFSCKLRCLCPSCHQKRELLWVQWANDLLAEAVPPAVLGCRTGRWSSRSRSGGAASATQMRRAVRRRGHPAPQSLDSELAPESTSVHNRDS